jgi:hypothetical protein
MKEYVAPELFVDNYVADTMIASAGTKNYNPDNNQNCWGCRSTPGATDPLNTQNSCIYTPGGANDALYQKYCV